MNNQQLIAIGNPCEFAEQCSSQQYREIKKEGKYRVSVSVTVNVGRE